MHADSSPIGGASEEDYNCSLDMGLAQVRDEQWAGCCKDHGMRPHAPRPVHSLIARRLTRLLSLTLTTPLLVLSLVLLLKQAAGRGLCGIIGARQPLLSARSASVQPAPPGTTVKYTCLR